MTGKFTRASNLTRKLDGQTPQADWADSSRCWHQRRVYGVTRLPVYHNCQRAWKVELPAGRFCAQHAKWYE